MRPALLAILFASAAARADLGINVYGLSYHFDRDKAREKGLTHEVNPGVGIRWRAADERQGRRAVPLSGRLHAGVHSAIHVRLRARAGAAGGRRQSE